MKQIKYILLFFILSIGISLFQNCETIDLDRTEDPNFITPDNADVDFYLNAIQENFVRQLEGNADFDPTEPWVSGGSTSGDGLSLFGSQLTRLINMNGRQYEATYLPSDSDDEWENFYVNILGNIQEMTPIAEESGRTFHIGIAQFIEAYTITAMVDFYGDIPYTEAIQGLDNTNPNVDSGSNIYAAAITLLDNAITNFQASAVENPSTEVFYNNDDEKWINAANTLKMKLYNQTRLVNSDAINQINTILNSSDYITASSDDFQYNWPATSNTNPDTRHPRYGLNYQGAGANDYMSNWLMNLMTSSEDPRVRYYFFRQTECTPGASCLPDGNEETLQCSLQTAPQHYLDNGFTFCYLENGYWGRNHGDTSGTPPDGFLRTTFGVYPAGGNFDDNRFADDDPDNDGIAVGSGGGGRGITPILTAAWVDFMQAELAMAQNDPNTAKTFMLDGIRKHIDKVMSFITLDASANTSFAPSATDVTNYITSIDNAFDSAPTMEDKWNVFAEQFLIASFGNGVEAYNFYRRTGYPTTIEPNLEPDPGIFIRSLFYPSNAVNTNSNIAQKPNVAQPVFWDNNPNAPLGN